MHSNSIALSANHVTIANTTGRKIIIAGAPNSLELNVGGKVLSSSRDLGFGNGITILERGTGF